MNLRGVTKSLYQPITQGSAVSYPAGSGAEPQPSTILVNFGQKRSICAIFKSQVSYCSQLENC